ncbi:MAG: TasA family protein [Rhodoglobus sp.]
MASSIRHRTIATVLDRLRPKREFRVIALVAVTLVVSVLLGALGAGGTYAYLNSSVSAQPPATLTAGTASLSVSAGAQNFSNIAPGQTRTGLFTLTNVGDVPLNLTISSITGPSVANGLTATVGNSTCGGTQYTSGAFGVGTLAKGASATVCLTVSMGATPPNSAQWASTTVSVLIAGAQA